MKTSLKLFISFFLIFAHFGADANPVQQLAQRIIPKKVDNFIFEILPDSNGPDFFEISSQGKKINIKGSTPVSVASGLNWYLKYYCNCHVSNTGEQLNLPKRLPRLPQPVRKETTFKYSYYLNYCTFNYTMAFWGWEEWEKEIDRMALKGVNLPLAMVGTEKVWQETLRKVGFSNEEILEFIPGPAFNAWWLMGNMDGWGGPVSENYIKRQVKLQQKILARMKAFGMEPVLPGFFGMVPNVLQKKFPNADIREQGLWAGGFKRPAILSPTDSLFFKIAGIFYDEQKKLYGNINFFSGDPFHEGGNSKGIDLGDAGVNIIKAMKNASPNGMWVFQGWQHNPPKELIRKIAKDDLLILDLDCDNLPYWEKRNGWSGFPWIWNTVSNYGENAGMFGRLDVIANEPFRALNHPEYSKNMVGVGTMMEGIENNSVIDNLLFELKWHKTPPDLNQWLTYYAKSRYGKVNHEIEKAWHILRHTVYGKELAPHSFQQGTSESILCARPSIDIKSASSWGTSELYYEPTELAKAWRIFVNEAGVFRNSSTYKYDLVDLTRQVLANYGQVIYKNMIQAFDEHNKELFKKYSAEMIELINDQNRLLNSHEKFMLGPWLRTARKMGSTQQEKDLFEYNARTQITTWSFQNSNLVDYSHREWGGLLDDFYLKRWEMFIQNLSDKLEGENPAELDYYTFEREWTEQTKEFPTSSIGDSFELADELFEKYYSKIIR